MMMDEEGTCVRRVSSSIHYMEKVKKCCKTFGLEKLDGRQSGAAEDGASGDVSVFWNNGSGV